MLFDLSMRTDERTISEESLKGKLVYVAGITCSDYTSSESCVAPYLIFNVSGEICIYIALCYTVDVDAWDVCFVFRLEP